MSEVSTTRSRKRAAARIFEASHTYKLKGRRQYLTIVEAQGNRRRYYKAYLADRLEGPWKGLADTLAKPFAACENVAQDDDLLRLLREANFAWVFIGIESPDIESLKETKKSQNLRAGILDSVRKIYGHGIDILAGFIIGFVTRLSGSAPDDQLRF